MLRSARENLFQALFLGADDIQQEVTALCDHIVIIAQGRVVAAGSPDDIRRDTGHEDMEEAFVSVIGSSEGLE